MSTYCSLTPRIIPHHIMLTITTSFPLSLPSLSLWVILSHLLPRLTQSRQIVLLTRRRFPNPCSSPVFSPQALSGDSAINPSLGRLVLQCLCPALHSLLTDGLKPYQSDLIAGRRPNSAWSLVQASTRAGSISCIIALNIKNELLPRCSRVFFPLLVHSDKPCDLSLSNFLPHQSILVDFIA